jgi:uncharacterized membrane protein YedE/YeeE
MKAFRYLLVGFVFGIVLTKSEAVSWYRIYEMFHFQSFHMYGIIMTAVLTGFVGVRIFKSGKFRSIKGEPIVVPDKEAGSARYWIGGFIFGLGWALTGTCPGPIFILVGAGFLSVIFVLVGALIGTFIYGMVRDRLPH